MARKVYSGKTAPTSSKVRDEAGAIDITCKPVQVYWRDESTSRAIVAVRIITHPDPGKKGGLITCIGELLPIQMNLIYEAHGVSGYNTARKEEQFQVQSWLPQETMDERGILELLSREAAGIGPAKAKIIVQKFGEKTFDVIRDTPHLILGLIGGSIQSMEKIVDWAKGHNADTQFRKQLYGLGLTSGLINKIIRFYGTDVFEKVKQDVFGLTKIPTVGFLTAAKVADALGVPADDPGRIQACLLFCLEDICQDKGHTCLRHEDLITAASTMLQLSYNMILAQLMQLRTDGKIAIRGGKDGDDCPIAWSEDPDLFKELYPDQYQELMGHLETPELDDGELAMTDEEFERPYTELDKALEEIWAIDKPFIPPPDIQEEPEEEDDDIVLPPDEKMWYE